jgi:hypothetical protein
MAAQVFLPGTKEILALLEALQRCRQLRQSEVRACELASAHPRIGLGRSDWRRSAL